VYNYSDNHYINSYFKYWLNYHRQHHHHYHHQYDHHHHYRQLDKNFQKFKKYKSNTNSNSMSIAIKSQLRKVLLYWYNRILLKTNVNINNNTFININTYIVTMNSFKLRRSLLLWRRKVSIVTNKKKRKEYKKILKKKKKTIEMMTMIMMMRDYMKQWKIILKSTRYYDNHTKAWALIRLKRVVVRNAINRKINSIGTDSHSIYMKRLGLMKLLIYRDDSSNNDNNKYSSSYDHSDEDSDDSGWLTNDTIFSKPPIPHDGR